MTIATGENLMLFAEHLAKKKSSAALRFFGLAWGKVAIGWLILSPDDVNEGTKAIQ